MILKKIVGAGAIASAIGFSAIGLAGVANAAPTPQAAPGVVHQAQSAGWGGGRGGGWHGGGGGWHGGRGWGGPGWGGGPWLGWPASALPARPMHLSFSAAGRRTLGANQCSRPAQRGENADATG